MAPKWKGLTSLFRNHPSKNLLHKTFSTFFITNIGVIQSWCMVFLGILKLKLSNLIKSFNGNSCVQYMYLHKDVVIKQA